MKLEGMQLQTVEDQLGVDSIPEEHPVTPELKRAFGDHTFFLDAEGLNIVEPDPSEQSARGAVVKLASWTENRDALRGHDPEVLPVIVKFEQNGSDPAA
jgi:hypothetical protein